MKRIGIFFDTGNVYHSCLRKYNRKVNFRKLHDFAACAQTVICAIAYGVGSINNVKYVRCLVDGGFAEVNIKKPKCFVDGSKKADQDLTIASDVFKFLEQLDVVVLITADGDFAPVVKLCRERGKHVVVIGCTISFELKEVANQCFEIGEELLETPEAA